MQPMNIMPPRAAMIGGTGLSCERRNGKILHWHYSMPIDSHDKDDIGARNLATARLTEFGADHHDLAKAFGLAERRARNLMHAFRTGGWREFAKPIKRRGPSAIGEERKAAAERLLAEGASLRQDASESDINLATPRWNMRKGRIGAAVASGPSAEGMEVPDAAGEETASEETAAPADRGTREMRDRAAPMGCGARDPKERVKASKGELPDGAAPEFDEPRTGVRGGAILVALPGMPAPGLPHRVREFLSAPAGHCSLELVLMARTSLHLLGKTAAELLGRESPAGSRLRPSALRRDVPRKDQGAREGSFPRQGQARRAGETLDLANARRVRPRDRSGQALEICASEHGAPSKLAGLGFDRIKLRTQSTGPFDPCRSSRRI